MLIYPRFQRQRGNAVRAGPLLKIKWIKKGEKGSLERLVR